MNLDVHLYIHQEPPSDVLAAIRSQLSTILKTQEKMMSAISEFTGRVNEHFDKISAAVDGLSGDVQSLKDEIIKLQGTAGNVTPEDQALLDSIQAKVEAAATKLAALDDLTTPPTPNP